MSYTIEVTPEDNHLHITVGGENSPDTVRNYLSDILAAVKRHGQSNILIEENLRGPSIKILDMFDVVTKASERTAPNILRIAYIDMNKDHDRKALQFAETVALNRGINVRLFDNRQEALRWLLDRK